MVLTPLVKAAPLFPVKAAPTPQPVSRATGTTGNGSILAEYEAYLPSEGE